jgi:hypothetical protein
VTGDPLAQRLRLADVDDPSAGVAEQVDAGRIREAAPLLGKPSRAVLFYGFGLDRHAGLS